MYIYMHMYIYIYMLLEIWFVFAQGPVSDTNAVLLTNAQMEAYNEADVVDQRRLMIALW